MFVHIIKRLINLIEKVCILNCNSQKCVTQQRMKNIFRMPEDNLIHHFNHFSSFTQGKSKQLKYPIEILALKIVWLNRLGMKGNTSVKEEK